MTAHVHPLGTVDGIGTEPIQTLADDLRGDVILPDLDEYEDARNVWIVHGSD